MVSSLLRPLKAAVALFLCVCVLVSCRLHGSSRAVQEIEAKSIWFEDDRVGALGTFPQERSVVGLVRKAKAQEEEQAFVLPNTTFAKQRALLGRPLCCEEPFRTEPVSLSCTGFLVADDLVVTAAHCVPSELVCEQTLFVFDFHYGAQHVREGKPVYQVSKNNVYACAQMMAIELDRYSTGQDWAILRMDRPARGRPLLSVRQAGIVPLHERLYTMGHPHGLPLKVVGLRPEHTPVSGGGRPGEGGNITAQLPSPSSPSPFPPSVSPFGYGDNMVINQTAFGFFTAAMDIYSGQSGSPVFNLNSGEVEGVAVRGSPSFVKDEDMWCYKSAVCPMEGANDNGHVGSRDCMGLQVSRAAGFAPFLNRFAAWRAIGSRLMAHHSGAPGNAGGEGGMMTGVKLSVVPPIERDNFPLLLISTERTLSSDGSGRVDIKRFPVSVGFNVTSAVVEGVPGSKVVAIGVRYLVQHDFDPSEVSLSLTSPTGTKVELGYARGGRGVVGLDAPGLPSATPVDLRLLAESEGGVSGIWHVGAEDEVEWDDGLLSEIELLFLSIPPPSTAEGGEGAGGEGGRVEVRGPEERSSPPQPRRLVHIQMVCEQTSQMPMVIPDGNETSLVPSYMKPRARQEPAANLRFRLPTADEGGGDTSPLFDPSAELMGVGVALETNHTFVSDLVTALQAPGGETVFVGRMERQGWRDSQRELQQFAFGVGGQFRRNLSLFAQGLGAETARSGPWTLTIADVIHGDRGEIVDARLSLLVSFSPSPPPNNDAINGNDDTRIGGGDFEMGGDGFLGIASERSETQAERLFASPSDLESAPWKNHPGIPNTTQSGREPSLPGERGALDEAECAEGVTPSVCLYVGSSCGRDERVSSKKMYLFWKMRSYQHHTTKKDETAVEDPAVCGKWLSKAFKCFNDKYRSLQFQTNDKLAQHKMDYHRHNTQNNHEMKRFLAQQSGRIQAVREDFENIDKSARLSAEVAKANRGQAHEKAREKQRFQQRVKEFVAVQKEVGKPNRDKNSDTPWKIIDPADRASHSRLALAAPPPVHLPSLTDGPVALMDLKPEDYMEQGPHIPPRTPAESPPSPSKDQWDPPLPSPSYASHIYPHWPVHQGVASGTRYVAAEPDFGRTAGVLSAMQKSASDGRLAHGQSTHGGGERFPIGGETHFQASQGDGQRWVGSSLQQTHLSKQSQSTASLWNGGKKTIGQGGGSRLSRFPSHTKEARRTRTSLSKGPMQSASMFSLDDRQAAAVHNDRPRAPYRTAPRGAARVNRPSPDPHEMPVRIACPGGDPPDTRDAPAVPPISAFRLPPRYASQRSPPGPLWIAHGVAGQARESLARTEASIRERALEELRLAEEREKNRPRWEVGVMEARKRWMTLSPEAQARQTREGKRLEWESSGSPKSLRPRELATPPGQIKKRNNHPSSPNHRERQVTIALPDQDSHAPQSLGAARSTSFGLQDGLLGPSEYDLDATAHDLLMSTKIGRGAVRLAPDPDLRGTRMPGQPLPWRRKGGKGAPALGALPAYLPLPSDHAPISSKRRVALDFGRPVVTDEILEKAHTVLSPPPAPESARSRLLRIHSLSDLDRIHEKGEKSNLRVQSDSGTSPRRDSPLRPRSPSPPGSPPRTTKRVGLPALEDSRKEEEETKKETEKAAEGSATLSPSKSAGCLDLSRTRSFRLSKSSASLNAGHTTLALLHTLDPRPSLVVAHHLERLRLQGHARALQHIFLREMEALWPKEPPEVVADLEVYEGEVGLRSSDRHRLMKRFASRCTIDDGAHMVQGREDLVRRMSGLMVLEDLDRLNLGDLRNRKNIKDPVQPPVFLFSSEGKLFGMARGAPPSCCTEGHKMTAVGGKKKEEGIQLRLAARLSPVLQGGYSRAARKGGSLWIGRSEIAPVLGLGASSFKVPDPDKEEESLERWAHEHGVVRRIQSVDDPVHVPKSKAEILHEARKKMKPSLTPANYRPSAFYFFDRPIFATPFPQELTALRREMMMESIQEMRAGSLLSVPDSEYRPTSSNRLRKSVSSFNSVSDMGDLEGSAAAVDSPEQGGMWEKPEGGISEGLGWSPELSVAVPLGLGESAMGEGPSIALEGTEGEFEEVRHLLAEGLEGVRALSPPTGLPHPSRSGRGSSQAAGGGPTEGAVQRPARMSQAAPSLIVHSSASLEPGGSGYELSGQLSAEELHTLDEGIMGRESIEAKRLDPSGG
uniref:Peptidase S1 domain-containing protein n=1 Tax=Chromera velia CCMP2878 TaxID=1169474 RepID=A0A0G4ICJ7_9ALVE|eukprot:Cvel_2277.t1-p1 / transcript=Cvel_2277.t1 / gene=Cvel_2277 / organism=Chromera_velia_CCMP2878 / gene_product=hypothetical protein / transcript_product=hypothetical protein / location=Cvel_scaffold88:50371-63684(+) / protein_length=2196 / sequence_SO=supercontig / SO=protein_coding / is_pseudo=false